MLSSGIYNLAAALIVLQYLNGFTNLPIDHCHADIDAKTDGICQQVILLSGIGNENKFIAQKCSTDYQAINKMYWSKFFDNGFHYHG